MVRGISDNYINMYKTAAIRDDHVRARKSVSKEKTCPEASLTKQEHVGAVEKDLHYAVISLTYRGPGFESRQKQQIF